MLISFSSEKLANTLIGIFAKYFLNRIDVYMVNVKNVSLSRLGVYMFFDDLW